MNKPSSFKTLILYSEFFMCLFAFFALAVSIAWKCLDFWAYQLLDQIGQGSMYRLIQNSWARKSWLIVNCSCGSRLFGDKTSYQSSSLLNKNSLDSHKYLKDVCRVMAMGWRMLLRYPASSPEMKPYWNFPCLPCVVLKRVLTWTLMASL